MSNQLRAGHANASVNTPRLYWAAGRRGSLNLPHWQEGIHAYSSNLTIIKFIFTGRYSGQTPFTARVLGLNVLCVIANSASRACYTHFRNDDTDQIHDETARQSRSALGIGLTHALIFQVQIRFPRLRQMSGLLFFADVFWPVAKLERHVTVNHAMRRFESCPASQI